MQVKLTRLRSDGVPDPLFSSDGTVDVPMYSLGNPVSETPSRGVIAFGRETSLATNATIACANGSLDTGFGSSGKVRLGPTIDPVRAMVVFSPHPMTRVPHPGSA